MTFFLTPRNIYPTGPYGEVFWGGYWAPPPSIAFGVSDAPRRSKITTRSQGFDTIILQWEEPEDTYDYVMLVRNQYGPPLTPTDGSILFQTPKGTLTKNEFSDTHLQQGTYYYYSLFIRIAQATPNWQRVGTATGLTNTDYGSGLTMYELLPEWYRVADADEQLVPLDTTGEEVGPLRRFLELIGREVDLERTFLQNALDSTNASKIRSDLLPYASEMYGFPYEPYLGDRQTRRLYGNWIHILKRKGTITAVEDFASAVTGYSATATIGGNMLLDRNDSDFYETLGRWHLYVGSATVTRDTGQAWLPASTRAALKLTSTANSNTMAVCAGPSGLIASGPTLTAFDARHYGVPVVAGKKYWLTFATKANGATRTVGGRIIWLDVNGSIFGGSFSSATEAQSTGNWTQHTFSNSFTAPTGAAYAVPAVEFISCASGEIHWVGGAQIFLDDNVSLGGTPAQEEENIWEPARQVHIKLAPVRVNIVPNPSFEVTTTPWAALDASDTRARSTLYSLSGASSLELTTAGHGGSGFSSRVYFNASNLPGFDSTTGTLYQFGGWLRGPSGNSADTGVTVSAFIEYFNQISLTAVHIDGPQVPIAYGQWVPARLSHELTSQATAVNIVVRFGFKIFNVPADGRKYYIDAAMLEIDGVPNSYFDASVDLSSFDYLWSGAAHASASLWYPNRFIRNKRLQTLLPNMLPELTSAVVTYGL